MEAKGYDPAAKPSSSECLRFLGTVLSTAILGLAGAATYFQRWLYSSKTVTFYDETGAYLDVYTTFRFGVLSSIMRIEPELTSPLLNEEGFWWPFNCFASLAPAARDELNIYLTVIWACWGAFMLIGVYIAFYFYADAACVSRCCKLTAASFGVAQGLAGVGAVYGWYAFKDRLEQVFTRDYVEVHYLHLQFDLGWYLAAIAAVLALLQSAVLIYGSCGSTEAEPAKEREVEFTDLRYAAQLEA